ncbi:MAG: hypothetical protein R3240_14055 [Gammaproteobacteria bacterium]|nr:hypothetical protein [Gammaproteobacteria bacterium]
MPDCALKSVADFNKQAPQENEFRGKRFVELNQSALAKLTQQNLDKQDRLRRLISLSENIDQFFELIVQEDESNYQPVKPYSYPAIASKSGEKKLQAAVLQLLNDQYKLFSEQIVPAFEKEGYAFLDHESWNPQQTAWLYEYFEEFVQPLISPIVLDITHPFPRIHNQNLCLFIALKGENAFGKKDGLVIIQIPIHLQGFIRLPKALSEKHVASFVMMEELIKKFVYTLFEGFSIDQLYLFRVTRSLRGLASESGEVAEEMYSELQDTRKGGAVVRLELEKQCPLEFQTLLCETFKINRNKLYLSHKLVNMKSYLKAIESLESDRVVENSRFARWKMAISGAIRRLGRLFSRKQLKTSGG